jgi:hypothetical protein
MLVVSNRLGKVLHAMQPPQKLKKKIILNILAIQQASFSVSVNMFTSPSLEGQNNQVWECFISTYSIISYIRTGPSSYSDIN